MEVGRDSPCTYQRKFYEDSPLMDGISLCNRGMFLKNIAFSLLYFENQHPYLKDAMCLPYMPTTKSSIYNIKVR